jgi:hypothetical protein
LSEPHLTSGGAVLVTAAGVSATAALEAGALAWFGIPLAAVTAAMTGALVPALLLDPGPLLEALRRWVGSVAFALITTALVVLVLQLDRGAAIGVAGLTACFAREIFAAARGEVGPLVAAIRAKLTGSKGG